MNPIEPPLPEGSKEIFLSHVKHSTGLAKVSTQTIFKFEEYMARFWRNNATNICQGEKKTYSLNKGIIQLLFQRVPQDYVPSFGPDDSQLRPCGMPLESRCATIEGAGCSEQSQILYLSHYWVDCCLENNKFEEIVLCHGVRKSFCAMD